MAYMAQQAVETAIRDAFLDRPDALAQAAEAARCRAWLESLPLPAVMIAAIVEPIAALEDGLREAERRRRRGSAPER
jgi:hypothetical protein